jgi:hypothetical protein
MRIGHKDLEHVRADYRVWVAAAVGPQPSGPRRSYVSVTRDAIYRFHKSNDAAIARASLVRALDSFRNVARREEALFQLDAYIQWAAGSRDIVIDSRINIKFDLGRDVILGGQISRLDGLSRTGGYRAILLGPPPDDWPGDFRFPVLQRVIAHVYARDESEVQVGVQQLDGTGLQSTSFSTDIVDRAVRRARRLAGRVADEVARLRT